MMAWFGYVDVKDAVVESSKKAFEQYREIKRLEKFERFTNTVQSLGGDTMPVEFRLRGDEVAMVPLQSRPYDQHTDNIDTTGGGND